MEFKCVKRRSSKWTSILVITDKEDDLPSFVPEVQLTVYLLNIRDLGAVVSAIRTIGNDPFVVYIDLSTHACDLPKLLEMCRSEDVRCVGFICHVGTSGCFGKSAPTSTMRLLHAIRGMEIMLIGSENYIADHSHPEWYGAWTPDPELITMFITHCTENDV